MTKPISFESLYDEFIVKPEVKAAYDAMENEFALAHALISARSKAKLSQKNVAERMNTTQSAIARIESGRHAPSMSSLARYATAVGRTITIDIHPVPQPAAGER